MDTFRQNAPTREENKTATVQRQSRVSSDVRALSQLDIAVSTAQRVHASTAIRRHVAACSLRCVKLHAATFLRFVLGVVLTDVLLAAGRCRCVAGVAVGAADVRVLGRS